ncbi:ATP-binding protein [Streptomyces sp. 796.1]|uniref:ATP-binding protein n=1 Tax=Streptomyces sp. 796.1 TaxID=3163029 RepID=UPI0039C8FA58
MKKGRFEVEKPRTGGDQDGSIQPAHLGRGRSPLMRGLHILVLGMEASKFCLVGDSGWSWNAMVRRASLFMHAIRRLMGAPGSLRLTYCRCVLRGSSRSPSGECERPWGKKAIGDVWRRKFPRDMRSIQDVWSWAKGFFREEAQAWNARSIFGELGANAVKHGDNGRGDGEIYVEVLTSGPKVAVSIEHTGGAGKGIPKLRYVGTESEGGRGLHIVCALAEQVVVHRGRDGWRIVAFLRSGEEGVGRPS